MCIRDSARCGSAAWVAVDRLSMRLSGRHTASRQLPAICPAVMLFAPTPGHCCQYALFIEARMPTGAAEVDNHVAHAIALEVGGDGGPGACAGRSGRSNPAHNRNWRRSLSGARCLLQRKKAPRGAFPLPFWRCAYILSIIALPKAEQETSCAPSIRRAKS